MSALLEWGEQKGEKNEKNYKKPIMLPRTPYIYFLKQRRSQYPGIDFNDIIPMLYQEWTKLSTEDREEWRQKAENYIQLRTTM
jgi:hypothetical protein